MSWQWILLSFLLAGFATVVVILVGLYLRKRVYSSYFFYDRKADYQYEFAEKATLCAPVKISKDSFRWPHTEQKFDTALVEICLKSSPLGWVKDPYIDIVSKEVSIRQYFERGCEGIRYLNITQLTTNGIQAGEEIVLRGHGVTCDTTEGAIILFHSAVSNPRVVVVAPHPDDAEIAAFAFYLNHDSSVVTITAGDYGPDPYRHIPSDRSQHFVMKGWVRVIDSITVPLLGNVDPVRCINLGFFDNTLPDMYEKPEQAVPSLYADISDRGIFKKLTVSDLILPQLSEATWENLIIELKNILNKIEPSIIVTPHPVLDSHPDHQLTTVAVCQAIQNLGLTQGNFFLYTAHVPGTCLYPFGPAGSNASLPPWHEKQWLFDQIYSHALNSDDQIVKRFALEATRELNWNPQSYSRAWARRVFTLLTGTDESYFRRAIRSEELFFVVPFAASAQLIDLFERSAKAQLPR